MNIGQLVDLVEQEYGPSHRRIKVSKTQKADGSMKKEPKWERNQYTQSQISQCRGYGLKHQDPNKAFTDYSIYLKHTPGLWCVDVDTKDFGNSELINRLVESGCYSTETDKGFHFYIKCPDAPTDFTNEVRVFKDFDGDFLGRDMGVNVWEKKTRTIDGNHFMEFEWGDLSQYLDIDKMNEDSSDTKKQKKREKKAKAIKEKKQADEDPDPLGLEDFTDDMIDNFLGRINNEGKSAKDYDDWLKIGICLFNCYKKRLAGFNKWNEWSKKSQKHDEDTIEEKWDSFKTEHHDPCGWKTLRFMANKDNPRNVYQALFEQRGEDGLTKELNKHLCFNLATGEYIQEFMNRDKKDEHIFNTFKKATITCQYEKYKFWVIPEEGKKYKVNPFTIWNENINRRDVKRIVFDPRPKEHQDPDVFNIWRGYNISMEDSAVFDEEDARPLLDHIYNIWCQGRDDHYEYVINWFAHILQKPWSKISVLLALQSEEGAGKGVVMEMIGEIMGSSTFKAVASASGIVGEFNGELEGKCLIDLDEAIWGGSKEIASKMKNLITERRQQVNKKHKETYEIDNSTAFMITTNNELFAGIDRGGRRYACLRLDNKYAGISNAETEAYFSEVRGVAPGVSEPSAKVVGGFAKYLYKRDLTNWSARRVPQTPLLQDQIERGMNCVVRWWKDMLSDGRWGLPNWDNAMKNTTSYDGEKKTEYDHRVEYYGFIKNKYNGRIAEEKYKSIIGRKKYYQKKDFNGSIMPQEGETKSQWTYRVYYEAHCGGLPKHLVDKVVQKSDGTPKEYTLQWEGEDIVETEIKTKVIYQGYNPKWLFQMYLQAHKDKKLGYGNPHTFNSFSQWIHKIAPITKKKHGASGKDQETTWEAVPLKTLRDYFNKYYNYQYEWDEDVDEIEPMNGGKLVPVSGCGDNYQKMPGNWIGEDDEDPVAE